jgi:hypothetical protein
MFRQKELLDPDSRGCVDGWIKIQHRKKLFNAARATFLISSSCFMA